LFTRGEQFMYKKGGIQMVGLESSMEQAENAQKIKKPKVDKEENERLKKFNEELRSRKAPQPKA